MSGFDDRIGDLVLVRGRPWTISDVVTWPDCTLLRLTSIGWGQTRALLTPFDRPRRIDRPRGIQVVHRQRCLHELRRLGAELTPYGGAMAAARASATLLPHQIEPLLAVVRHGATRLLIADAVGLGKTIQAGLILSELAARAEDFRAIVLVPAGLREQWGQELRDRFTLAVTEADAAWLRVSATERPMDVNPWSLPGIYVASIDFAKRAEVLRALEDTRWDLAVVDEAHLASASSDRRTAAHAVAAQSLRTVLLTATPDMGDPAAFDALCGIGAIDNSEAPVLFFRRMRADVADGPPRRSVFLRVRPTAAERRMHELLERYTRRIWEEAAHRGDARARLAAIVLRKRALSSAASLAASAQRRLDLLAGASAQPERQLLLPLADEDPLTDGVSDEDLAAPGLADTRRERRWLASITEAARQASRAESKTARLLRWLARIREPIIVFTEYRDTLHRLERLIRATGRPLTTLHGGLERVERRRVQSAFNAGGLTLLATDAAAEGLNLHQHCRIVLHYELPWRPARIEQRAGRVDRLGQTRRVHEIALIAAGTAERFVLAPLAARAARARAAGDVTATLLESLTEAAVSDLVMLGTAGTPGSAPLPSSSWSPGARAITRTADLRAEAAIEVARLETTRRWISQSPALERAARAPRRIVSAPINPRRAGFRPGLGLVFDQTLTDLDGRRVHSEAVVLFVEMNAGWNVVRSARWLRRLVEEVRMLSTRPGSPIHEQLTGSLDLMAERIGRLRTAARDAIRLREERLRHGQPSAATQMVQTGLFDRRAVQRMAQRAAARDAHLHDADARLHSLERGAHLLGGVELTAALVICGDTR